MVLYLFVEGYSISKWISFIYSLSALKLLCPGQVSLCIGPSSVSFSTVGHLVKSGVPVVSIFLLLFPIGPFIICCIEAVQSALSSSSGGMSPYIGTELVCGRRCIQILPVPPSWTLLANFNVFSLFCILVTMVSDLFFSFIIRF